MYNEHISLAALTPHEALVGFGLLHTAFIRIHIR